MALKRSNWPDGTLVAVEHTSSILADNPLGDPATREFHVWVPPAYDTDKGRNRGRRYPVLFDLVGYTGSGMSHTHWRAFDENVPERAARLMHQRKLGPCIIVFPDCFTALGGNQYINSAAIGNYADYLTRELIPFIDKEFRTLASREHRGCFGKSSGGYGAMIHGMKYARYWGAIGNHSGDAYFDFIYRSDWPNTLNQLARYKTKNSSGSSDGLDDGRIKAFLNYVWKRERLSSPEVHCLMNLCMAATYDPDPDAPNGFRVPFDLDTGELIKARWNRWLKHDPALLVKKHQDNLKSLKGIYMDCGRRDQYHIHYGSRILARDMKKFGIKHRYEEFDGTHSGIDSRMDVSLPFLQKCLRG
ncbi:MAG: alpha/beta hydrolase [Gammaproteobacteria bacterium]